MNRIKELRKEKGITITQLSEALKIPQSSLTNYENGKRQPNKQDVWKKIANYFDVSVGYLMGFSIEETENEQIDEYADPFDLIEEGKLWSEVVLNMDKRIVEYYGLGGGIKGKSVIVKYNKSSLSWTHIKETHEEIYAEKELLFANENITQEEYESVPTIYRPFPGIHENDYVILSIRYS